MKLTRRDAIKTAAGVLALAGNAQAAVGPVMEKVSAYMAAAAGRALPEEAGEKTKQHILDTFAAMVSGTELPPGKIALKMAAAYKGERTATIAGSNLLCSPIDAALVNGLLAHSDETDDSHALSHSHPGCSMVPAALAAGEQFGVDGNRFLRSVALGYDIGPRVTMTLGALPYQMATFRSSHSISSDFGASAAAGCAAGLNAQQMRWLLDYASQQASGTTAWQRDTDHIEKGLVFGGFPARNGVTAALLIQLGGTGVDDVFSGPSNFFAAFVAKGKPEQMLDGLGERYEVTRTNIKKWTVGSPIQAPLDCLENISKKKTFDAKDVKSVVVRMPSSEANTVNNREMPDISLQHMVAVMLIDKAATFAAAHDKPRMQDPAILREKAKVNLVFDEELEKLAPLRVAIVEVTLNDGNKLTERVDYVRGTVENPMTRQEVIAKSQDLMSPILGSSKTGQLISKIFGLENVKDIRELRGLLQKS